MNAQRYPGKRGPQHEGPGHKKIEFHRVIQDVQARLASDNVVLNSFIVSPARFGKLNWGKTRQEMEDRHVFFMVDKTDDTRVYRPGLNFGLLLGIRLPRFAVISSNFQGDNAMDISALVGVLILIADIWAIINIIGSRAETVQKLLWSLLVLLLPLIGLIIWFFAGPRSSRV